MLKKNPANMTDAGLMQPGPFRSVDKNNDGIHDLYRMSQADIWIKSDVANQGSNAWTSTMAHEIGHVFALDNCAAGCNSVMTESWAQPLFLGPPTCDNAQVTSIMQ